MHKKNYQYDKEYFALLVLNDYKEIDRKNIYRI